MKKAIVGGTFMNSACPNLDRFLRVFSRRLWLRRSIDRCELTLFAGSVAALVVAAGGVWLGYTSWIAILILALTGIGILFHARRARPSLRLSAIEADRQLQLNDLLSTAHSLSRASSDQWNAIVLAQAEHQCQSLNPSDGFSNAIHYRRPAVCIAMIALTLLLIAIPSAYHPDAPFRFAANLDTARPAEGQFSPVSAMVAAASQGGADHQRGRVAEDSKELHPARLVAQPSPPSKETPQLAESKQNAASSRQRLLPDARSPVHAQLDKTMSAADLDTMTSGPAAHEDGTTSTSGQPVKVPSASASASWHPGAIANSPSGKWIEQGKAIPAEYRDLIHAYFDRNPPLSKP